MKTTFHKADTRGHADFGWLNTYHTFSFGKYYDPERVNFGALRVLNDDTVAPAAGFASHPHSNMEIISIPTEGKLEHKDSQGNIHTIKKNDIQVMSAGKGIVHSEKNGSNDEFVKFFQIWILPNKQDVEPRYDQITLDTEEKKNKLTEIISPDTNDRTLWIFQDTWFSMGSFDEDLEIEYKVHKRGNGVYLFVIEGDVTIADKKLSKRDGLGIWETDKINFKVASKSEILLMEVPMIEI